jgi:hypothetical protein
VTLDVVKLLRLRVFSFVQPLNMLLMFVTFAVLNVLRFREVKPVQPLNMLAMLVTLAVLRYERPVMVVSFVQPENQL